MSVLVMLPLTTTGVLAISEAAAFAHTTDIVGTPTCHPANGTYSIRWVGATDLVPAGDTALVTTTSHAPAGSSVPSVVESALGPNQSYTFEQTGIPGDAGSASVSVHVSWTGTDTFAANAAGSVSDLPPCAPPPPVTQHLSGHLYLCPASGATSTEAAGGTLSATGPQSIPAQANPLGSTAVAAGDYLMSASAPAGYTFVSCNGFTGSGTSASRTVTVPAGGDGVGIFYVREIPPVTQTISGHLYSCPTSGATTTEVAGGTLAVSGPSTIPAQANPLASTSVPGGAYTMSATAPAGYAFVSCNGFTGSGHTASQPVTVPAGGAGVGIFYVRQVQTIAGHLYLCPATGATTTEVPGGTLAASGETTLPAQPNPLGSVSVPAGDYLMRATAPSGYVFVSCAGFSGSGTSASRTVSVPVGGAGVGVFYVRPIVFPTVQSIAGHLYLCPTSGPTTTEALGGTLAASGPELVPAHANPMPSTYVRSGTYLMTAIAPAGYEFVTCGGLSASGPTASLGVYVPPGQEGVGVFYVRQLVQTIAGHIYLCPPSGPTQIEEPGGTLITTGPQNLDARPNPLAVTEVPAGTYTMSAVAPQGFEFVTCGIPGAITSENVPGGDAAEGVADEGTGSTASREDAHTRFARLTSYTGLASGTATPRRSGHALVVSPSGTTAGQTVIVPAGGQGIGIFYVRQQVQTLAGHIYLCPSAGPTTAEAAGGTVAATGPQVVPAQGNPLASTSVLAGTYTMTATAPDGYEFVSCAGFTGSGRTASESVTVPAGSQGIGVFYVRELPGFTGGSGEVTFPPAEGGGGSPVDLPGGGGVGTGTGAPVALPFTGSNTLTWLTAGLSLLTFGIGLQLLSSRTRRQD